jgi:hypothetical protein
MARTATRFRGIFTEVGIAWPAVAETALPDDDLREVRTRRRAHFEDGRHVDVHVMGLLAEELVGEG